MSEYRVTHKTDAYEVGTDGETITAACVCGSGLSTRNQGLGRATVATWRTRHQTCTTPTETTGGAR